MNKKYFILSSLFIAYATSLYPSASQATQAVKKYTFYIVALGISSTMGAKAEYIKYTTSQLEATSFQKRPKHFFSK